MSSPLRRSLLLRIQAQDVAELATHREERPLLWTYDLPGSLTPDDRKRLLKFAARVEDEANAQAARESKRGESP